MFPVKQTVIYTFFAIKAVNPSKTLLLTEFFVMLPVKHTVIYTFFAITSAQNTCFCSVFNALASKNPAKSCYVQCFFHFWPFFHCRKATKMTQNSISIPSCAQTPKNPRKMSKTPPYSGLGAKPFLAPPAKADIATAILTNVIEHLVLLFCPPISTPSPPKRCGQIFAVTSGNHFREDCYKVQLKTKSGVRLANEAMHALKQLSMLPDAEMGLAPRQDMGLEWLGHGVNVGAWKG